MTAAAALPAVDPRPIQRGSTAPIGAMRCERSTLAVANASELIVRRWRCRRWRCDRCSPRLRRRLRRLAANGLPERLLTLTCRPSAYPNPTAAAQAIHAAWARIRRAIREQRPHPHLEYLAVWERTKRGWPHLHILFRGPYVPQAWLSDMMEELADSPIVDIRRISSPTEAAAYVSKYLCKDPSPFGFKHRYLRSRHWPLENLEHWRTKKAEPGTVVLLACGIPEELVLALVRAGVTHWQQAPPDTWRCTLSAAAAETVWRPPFSMRPAWTNSPPLAGVNVSPTPSQAGLSALPHPEPAG